MWLVGATLHRSGKGNIHSGTLLNICYFVKQVGNTRPSKNYINNRLNVKLPYILKLKEIYHYFL